MGGGTGGTGSKGSKGSKGEQLLGAKGAKGVTGGKGEKGSVGSDVEFNDEECDPSNRLYQQIDLAGAQCHATDTGDDDGRTPCKDLLEGKGEWVATGANQDSALFVDLQSNFQVVRAELKYLDALSSRSAGVKVTVVSDTDMPKCEENTEHNDIADKYIKSTSVCDAGYTITTKTECKAAANALFGAGHWNAGSDEVTDAGQEWQDGCLLNNDGTVYFSPPGGYNVANPTDGYLCMSPSYAYSFKQCSEMISDGQSRTRDTIWGPHSRLATPSGNLKLRFQAWSGHRNGEENSQVNPWGDGENFGISSLKLWGCPRA